MIFFALMRKIAGSILPVCLSPPVETKLSQLLDLMRAGDWHAAIRFAAKFPNLGSHRDGILRAKDALSNPDFYRQIKRDPDEIIQLGIAALRAKYLQS
jgi:hypothetical protein